VVEGRGGLQLRREPFTVETSLCSSGPMEMQSKGYVFLVDGDLRSLNSEKGTDEIPIGLKEEKRGAQSEKEKQGSGLGLSIKTQQKWTKRTVGVSSQKKKEREIQQQREKESS